MACVKCEMDIPTATAICPCCRAKQPTLDESGSRHKAAMLAVVASALILFGVPWVLHSLGLRLQPSSK